MGASSWLETMVQVRPAQRPPLLVVGGAQVLQSTTFGWLALGACALAGVAIIFYAASRSGAARQVALGSSLAGLAVLLGIAADQSIVNGANLKLSRATQPSDELTSSGGSLVRFNGPLEPQRTHVLLGENGHLRFIDGERASLSSPPAPVMARLRTVTGRSSDHLKVGGEEALDGAGDAAGEADDGADRQPGR